MQTISEIYIIGSCRSGLHALAAWIIPQINSTIAYFIGVLEGHITSYPIEFYQNGKLIELYQNLPENEKTDYVMYDIQDVCKISTLEKFIKQKKINIVSNKKIVLFLIRDPLNNMASRIKHFEQYKYFTKEINLSALDYWIECAKEYVNETNILLDLKKREIIDGYHFIFYDKWFKDIEYRKEISQKLNIPFNDNGLNIVRHEGWGSSFDAQNYDNNAQKMDVLNRWKTYEDNPEFLSLFEERPEIIEYYETIYQKDFPLKKKD